METGIYERVPHDVYRSWDAFSITNGLEILRSPGHYLHRQMYPIEPTNAMILGTRIHERILEPELFKEKYTTLPPFHVGLCDEKGKEYKNPKASKKYIQLVEDFREKNEGKELLDPDIQWAIDKAAAAVEEKVITRELLLADGDEELSFYLKAEEGKMNQKGRIDKWHKRLRLIVDLKTTNDASYDAFQKTILINGYYIQAAHYYYLAKLLGLDPVTQVVIVAVETSPPFGVGVFEICEDLLMEGLRMRAKIVEKIEKCIAYDSWPTYPETVQRVFKPDWLIERNEKLLG